MSNATRFVGRFFVLSLVVAAVTLWAGPAYAVSAAWTGATDADWSTVGPPTNWDSTPETVPGAGDTATFNAAAGGGGAVITTGNIALGNLAFDSSADAYTIGAAVGTGQITLDDSGAVTMSAAVANNELINGSSD